MVRLTQVHGSFAARVLVARLADEGIDARLRGPVDGPYRFTVGEMARVEVYVPEDQIDDAAYVLLANEVEDATALPEPRDAAIGPSSRRRRAGAPRDRGRRARAGGALPRRLSDRAQASRASSSSPLMRRNARAGRARSSNATSSWPDVSVSSSPARTLAPSFTASARLAPSA